MSDNYYIRKGFTAEALLLQLQMLESRLQEVGQLYDGAVTEPLSTVQKLARDNHREGYEYVEQIYDLYAEIGAVMQAQEQLS